MTVIPANLEHAAVDAHIRWLATQKWLEEGARATAIAEVMDCLADYIAREKSEGDPDGLLNGLIYARDALGRALTEREIAVISSYYGQGA